MASDVAGWNKTVNGQLEIELRRNDRLRVTGFVPKNTQQQRKHARSLNIQLVGSKDHDGFSTADLLCFPPNNLNIAVLFIHSHETNLGRQAQAIKELKKCKWFRLCICFMKNVIQLGMKMNMNFNGNCVKRLMLLLQLDQRLHNHVDEHCVIP